MMGNYSKAVRMLDRGEAQQKDVVGVIKDVQEWARAAQGSKHEQAKNLALRQLEAFNHGFCDT